MNTFNIDMEVLLEMCKAYDVAGKKGTGRVTLAGGALDVKELFENTVLASETSVSFSSFGENYGNCRLDVLNQSYNTQLFSAETSSLFAA